MEVGADLFARLKTLRASLASETPVRPSMAEALPARLGLDRARRRQWAMVEALPRSSVTRVGRGYAQLTLRELGASSLTGGVCTLCFLEKLLSHAGAEEAEVTMTQCRALGDDETRFELTWLA